MPHNSVQQELTEVLALSVHRSDAENALYRISRKV